MAAQHHKKQKNGASYASEEMGRHHTKQKNVAPYLSDTMNPRAPTSQFSPLKHDPVSLPPLNTHKSTPSPPNPLATRFASPFPDNCTSWVHRIWKNVCIALPKQGFFCVEDVTEPKLESSPKVKCCHQSKLKDLPPLERHILLFMSKQALLKGRGFLHADNNTLQCQCTHTFGSCVDCGNLDDASASCVGIFLQAYTKDGVNLVHRLMDSRWAKRQFHNLAFARLQGEPGMICINAYHPEIDCDETSDSLLYKESHESPLSFLHGTSLRAFKEWILHTVPQQQLEFPNKEMLDSVQDFFVYTELEGRQVFDELDRDADGKLTLDDIKVAMKKMKLPPDYAKDFMQNKQRLWLSKSFGWSEFSSFIQEKEPVIIQLFNSLGVSKSGTVNRIHIKDSLKKAGLSTTEANITAMMKFLTTDSCEYIKYSQFRRFMLLLPTEQLATNPWSVWLKAATTSVEEPSTEDWQVSVFEYMKALPQTIQIGAKPQRYESQAIPC